MIIVIIVTSVVAFGGLWNSRQAAWIMSRIRTAQAALKDWDSTAANAQRPCQRGPSDPALQDFVSKYGFCRSDEVRDWLFSLERARTDYVLTLRAPFFGIVFDVNDLGMLAGFTFSVLLLWFVVSVLREQNDLALAFRQARARRQLRMCYDLLSTRQVLTVPPLLDRSDERQSPVRMAGLVILLPRFLLPREGSSIARRLILLPLIVQIAIVWHDKLTLDFGKLFQVGSTAAVVFAEWSFLLVILALTLSSLMISRQVDGVWRGVATELEESKRLEEGKERPSK
ncbi:MAG TPA: hypothetical protein VIV88_17660 [Gemmatimonadales bacterium]